MKEISIISLIQVPESCQEDVFSPGNQMYSAINVFDRKKMFDFVAGKCSKIYDKITTSIVLITGIGYRNYRAVDYTAEEKGGVVEIGSGGAEKFCFL
jgi:hypothetical protein